MPPQYTGAQDDATPSKSHGGDANAEGRASAFRGTDEAHRSGGVPTMTIEIAKLDPVCLGTMLYFFERAIAISGYVLGVNPFDQPGVEAYKKNMFKLLKQ